MFIIKESNNNFYLFIYNDYDDNYCWTYNFLYVCLLLQTYLFPSKNTHTYNRHSIDNSRSWFGFSVNIYNL